MICAVVVGRGADFYMKRLGSNFVSIEQFVFKLSSAPEMPNVYNPYTDTAKAQNLSVYLSHMLTLNPKHVLIGEAPGHRGCRWSGVPFTDEFHLAAGGYVDSHPLSSTQYNIISATPHKESSASTIWSVLTDESYFPLLWNIFPFHPHKPGNHDTNRTPTKEEILSQSYFVIELLQLFPSVETVFALGKQAENRLYNMGISSDYIRHPARGGAAECKAKLREIAYKPTTQT